VQASQSSSVGYIVGRRPGGGFTNVRERTLERRGALVFYEEEEGSGIRLRHERTGCEPWMRGLRIGFPQSHRLLVCACRPPCVLLSGAALAHARCPCLAIYFTICWDTTMPIPRYGWPRSLELTLLVRQVKETSYLDSNAKRFGGQTQTRSDV
jgi:hypothetical protein